MVVIGIDPGTARTGYGVVRLTKADSLELVDYGVISTSPDQPMCDRLLSLYQSLTILLSKCQPDSAAVEKIFHQRNVSTAITVGQARGVALLALAEAGAAVVEYTPKVVKQAVTGYGNAGKRQIQEMVRTLLGMDTLPRPDDAADALAVAICHIHSSESLRRLEEQI
ncbi:MAG: crossover junction endodeoxyribonuclease RuvC [Anaerolineales bacterium]|jgi:crossover junction endodeoxyribonuclease RuvC